MSQNMLREVWSMLSILHTPGGRQPDIGEEQPRPRSKENLSAQLRRVMDTPKGNRD